MPDTVEVLESQYDQVIAYLSSKKGFLEDPSATPIEFIDTDAPDYTQVIDTIKRLASSSASLSEAHLLAAYRDIRAAEAENEIRLTTRAAYFADAAIEESDNVKKWTYSKLTSALLMRGKDISQGT